MQPSEKIRGAIREWVVKTNGKVRPEEIDDETPIIERRIISSLQIMDLILFLERLSERPIDVDQLKVGVFRNVNAIYRSFFQGASGGR